MLRFLNVSFYFFFFLLSFLPLRAIVSSCFFLFLDMAMICYCGCLSTKTTATTTTSLSFSSLFFCISFLLVHFRL